MNPACALPCDVLNDMSGEDVTEDVAVQYDPRQQWYYLPAQLSTELLVFKSMDSQIKDGASTGTSTTG
jgi:hypothetical protein